MKNIFTIIAVLCALVFAGCEGNLDTTSVPITNNSGNSITITGIPSQYRNMNVRIMSDIDGIEATATGYNEINRGRAIIPLLDRNMEDWTGSGEYFIILDLDKKIYVYTDGSPAPPMNNIKKYNFHSSETEIDFSKFSTNTPNPYQFTITGIHGSYNNQTGTVTVYNAGNTVLAEGEGDVSEGTVTINLRVNDIFNSDWTGGEQAALVFTIYGTNYVYTGGASLGSDVGEGTWGRAPKYNFGTGSSSVNFNQFGTNEEIFLPTRITITNLDSKFNTDHLLSVILSSNPGYNPSSTIRDTVGINSGTAEFNVNVSSKAGPLHIFLIVIKREKVLSDGIEFTKDTAVAAYKSKSAQNITTGLMLDIGSDFDEETDVPNIGGEGD